MRSLSWIVAGLCVLAGSACGGEVAPGGDAGSPSASSSGGGSGSSGGSSSGSSGGVAVPPCPSNPPTAGMRCVAPGQQNCAYISTGQSCQAFVCNSSSLWEASAAGC